MKKKNVFGNQNVISLTIGAHFINYLYLNLINKLKACVNLCTIRQCNFQRQLGVIFQICFMSFNIKCINSSYSYLYTYYKRLCQNDLYSKGSNQICPCPTIFITQFRKHMGYSYETLHECQQHEQFIQLQQNNGHFVTKMEKWGIFVQLTHFYRFF